VIFRDTFSLALFGKITSICFTNQRLRGHHGLFPFERVESIASKGYTSLPLRICCRFLSFIRASASISAISILGSPGQPWRTHPISISSAPSRVECHSRFYQSDACHDIFRCFVDKGRGCVANFGRAFAMTRHDGKVWGIQQCRCLLNR